MTDCNVRKRKQVLFESTMHPNVSHIFCCLPLVLYYRFPCDQKHSSKKKKKGYLSSNIIFIRPLLINLYVHSGATKSCHQDVLWKANGPTQRIELHVPLFTGKAGLGDNKKGDIYCSLQQCDVPRQITAQVGQAPPCWEEDESVSDAQAKVHLQAWTLAYVLKIGDQWWCFKWHRRRYKTWT